MRAAKNTIYASDVTTLPIKVKYTSSYYYDQLNSNGITVNRGVNNPIYTYQTASQETLVYRFARHMYYYNYLSGSFPTTSSQYDNFMQSTAASGTLEADVRYFPTNSGEEVHVTAIPRIRFGEKISPSTFKLSVSGSVNIYDDGNGNLNDYGSGSLATYLNNQYVNYPQNFYNTLLNTTGSIRVGNIFYSHGVVVLTNQSYQNIYDSYPTTSFTAESTIYENTVRCRVNENDFNYTLNPSAIVSGSSGTYIDAVTGSEFKPYATAVGIYNDADELILVGKLSTPYPIPNNTDITFVIRWDS